MARLIEVTRHSLEQFKARWPGHGNREAIRQLIAQEVADAFEEGRYATKQPRWAGRDRVRGKRNHNELDRTLRFCWTEDQKRMYLVDKQRLVTLVVTSIRPGAVDNMAE